MKSPSEMKVEKQIKTTELRVRDDRASEKIIEVIATDEEKASMRAAGRADRRVLWFPHRSLVSLDTLISFMSLLCASGSDTHYLCYESFFKHSCTRHRCEDGDRT